MLMAPVCYCGRKHGLPCITWWACVLQESTCLQLRQYLQMGEGPLLQKLFDDYLLQRLDSKQRAGSKWKTKGGAGNGPAGNLPVSLQPSAQLQLQVGMLAMLHTVLQSTS